MSNYKKVMVLIFFVIVLSGCSSKIDRTISPPSDTEWVNITIKNPSQYTRPSPIIARYISYTCLKRRISGFDGSLVTEPNYSAINVQLKQQANDIWEGKVAITGGGWCDWKLSVVTLDVKYTDTSHIEENLESESTITAEIAFDGDALRHKRYTVVDSDNLFLTPKYYLLIREHHMSEEYKTISFFCRDDCCLFLFKKIRNVTFSPIIDESKIVRVIGQKRKVPGLYSKMIYPDGSIAPERTFSPDFDKVDEMKLK